MTRAGLLDPVAARLRAATLAAWADHPVRFREDANAEEDHGAGWYRDRVVVELAQNAADAATGAGTLLLSLSTADRSLVAANTGAPLDAAGLTSLASLRASAKRAGPGDAAVPPTVGRFGVGFAAVRSVADEIDVVSGTGAVRFSAELTAAELARVPALADEVARRGAALPVLRLPFPGGDVAVPDGYDTAVRLVLRDDAAVAEVAAQLADLDDALLLALPRLGTVHVEVDGERRSLADVADRWLVVTAAGEHDAGLLADRPVEEREHRGWRLTWAVPRRGRPGVVDVVHAPTPTDDAITGPALLLGTFPLDPGRRRITPGPVTDALVVEAGRLWPELLLAARRAAERDEPAPDPLDLVPTGFPAGPLDAALREAVLDATRHAPVLATASGWVAPADAVVLAPPWDATDAPRLLGGWFDHLAQLPPRHRDLARSLEVAAVGLGELVEQVPATDPARLRELYALLASAPGDLDELGAAPVPLRDGRVVHGARGVVLVDDLGPAGVGGAGPAGLLGAAGGARGRRAPGARAPGRAARGRRRARDPPAAARPGARRRRGRGRRAADPGRPPRRRSSRRAGGPRSCCPRPTGRRRRPAAWCCRAVRRRAGSTPRCCRPWRPRRSTGGAPPSSSGSGCAAAWWSSGSTSWWPTRWRTGPTTWPRRGPSTTASCWR